MSTRGNYVFCEYPYKDIGNDEWAPDPSQIVDLKLGISDETPLIEKGHKIYVHWDNYPSGAIPRLFEFLSLDGAKARANDSPYLSAWFVTYNCCLGKHYELEPCNIATKNDFTGIGLENSLNSWCDYTYVIIPDKDTKSFPPKANGFRIFIFDWKLNFVDEIHTGDCLEELSKEEWWY